MPPEPTRIVDVARAAAGTGLRSRRARPAVEGRAAVARSRLYHQKMDDCFKLQAMIWVIKLSLITKDLIIKDWAL